VPARLVLSGGFSVTDGQRRHLQQQAQRLGFADLRACLQALLHDGWSIPQLATHLDTTQAIVRRAITTFPSHPAASSWPASANAPPSSAPPTARSSWASPTCGPT
jgi:hypothetical protein